MFLADVFPLQRQDFVSPRPCKREKANCSDYPRGAALVLLGLAQGVTKPCQALLGLGSARAVPRGTSRRAGRGWSHRA